MPENQQASKSNAERRRGRDRRRGAPSGQTQRTIILLAKLTGVLAGTLVGLLVTNIISFYFIEPLRDLTSEAEDIVKQGSEELKQVEPEFLNARTEWTPLVDLWESLSGKAHQRSATQPTEIYGDEAATPGAASAPRVSGEPGEFETHAAVSGEVVPAPQVKHVTITAPNGKEYSLAELDLLRDKYLRLYSKRTRLEEQINTWQGQIKEYERSINAVNMLGILVVMVFIFLGYLTYPLIEKLLAYSTSQWEQFSTELNQRAVQAVAGFMAGVVIALVLMLAAFNTFSMDAGVFALNWFRLLFGAFLVIILGLSGSLAGITYFAPARQAPDPYRELRLPAPPRLLDSSVIIDGRVQEIAAAGFMGGLLIVTNSVLRELQALADSSDERRRSKGRRGLELVRKMQEDPRIEIKVFDDDQLGLHGFGTDEQLIHVAKELTGVVATNDYNLNRVAAIRNVRVININELANAVKTNHIPGDFIDIGIVDRGKQHGQGVGYLPDGTMVVVEDGEPYIGHSETIKLTSVTQTVAGRLIFGRVDLAREEQNNGRL